MNLNPVTTTQLSDIHQLMRECRLPEKFLDTIIGYQGAWNYTIAERIIVLLNCYHLTRLLHLSNEGIEDLCLKTSNGNSDILWRLNRTQATALKKHLDAMYKQVIRKQVSPTEAKKCYEVVTFSVSSSFETDDQREAINAAYYLEPGKVKVVLRDGVIYRVFANGTMFDKVNLED